MPYLIQTLKQIMIKKKKTPEMNRLKKNYEKTIDLMNERKGNKKLHWFIV